MVALTSWGEGRALITSRGKKRRGVTVMMRGECRDGAGRGRGIHLGNELMLGSTREKGAAKG